MHPMQGSCQASNSNTSCQALAVRVPVPAAGGPLQQLWTHLGAALATLRHGLTVAPEQQHESDACSQTASSRGDMSGSDVAQPAAAGMHNRPTVLSVRAVSHNHFGHVSGNSSSGSMSCDSSVSAKLEPSAAAAAGAVSGHQTPLAPWLSLLSTILHPASYTSHTTLDRTLPAAARTLPFATLTVAPAQAVSSVPSPQPLSLPPSGQLPAELQLLAPPPASYSGANNKAELGRATWTFLHTLAAQVWC